MPADLLNLARAAQIKALAHNLGFDHVGITTPQPSHYQAQYLAWIAAGKHAAMDFLARNLDERLDLRKKFPWAKSVICVALSYYIPPDQTPAPTSSQPLGKIARYAWGRDYHRVLTQRLGALERAIQKELTPSPSPSTTDPLAADHGWARIYVDTGPILERELAQRAGLGWVGKNSLLIHPRHGSFFALGQLITNLELPPDQPLTDHCGTCTRCLDACPTHAIDPYSVDARKCLSYHTLENRGPASAIPPDIQAALKDSHYLAGCDICQDVCPFNSRPLPTREPDFQPRPPAPAIPLADVLAWDSMAWDIATRGKAHRRARYEMWLRNARILTE